MSFVKIIPMAFVMIAGPQIISAIMLATSERAKQNSLAFVGGAMLTTIGGVSVAYFAFLGLGLHYTTKHGSASIDAAWVFVVLLALLAVKVFTGRKNSEPPKWMATLQTAEPGLAFRLGALLYLLMPGDLLTMVAVGGILAAKREPLWNALPFVAATFVLTALPLLCVLALGARAQTVLPKLRDWMQANSWIVSEIVVVFFLVMELKTAVTG